MIPKAASTVALAANVVIGGKLVAAQQIARRQPCQDGVARSARLQRRGGQRQRSRQAAQHKVVQALLPRARSAAGQGRVMSASQRDNTMRYQENGR